MFIKKNIHSFIGNVVMVVCMGEREKRSAILDTTWDTYSSQSGTLPLIALVASHDKINCDV